MDESYAEIFKVAMLGSRLNDIALSMRCGSMFTAKRQWNEISDQLTAFCADIEDSHPKISRAIYDSAIDVAKSFSDFCRAEGILRGRLLAALRDYLSDFIKLCVDDGNYEISETQSGFVTMRNIRSGRYYHSTYDPVKEAKDMAESLYYDGMSEFHIFGGGLGYLPYQLWIRSHRMCDIYLYETDPVIIEYGYMFGMLGLIDEQDLHIVSVTDDDTLIEKIIDIREKNTGNIFISPIIVERIRQTKDPDVAFLINSYAAGMNQRYIRKSNAGYNVNGNLFCDMLPTPACDDWIVVAAGPSFDDNIDFLRDNIGKKNIIAVNRCISRLEACDIRPDYISVCDPHDAIIEHIEGHEMFTEGIPLIADVYSNCRFVKLYRGPVYIVPDSEDEYSREYMESHGISEWNCWGTVSSFALEAAYRLGAKKIYLVGLDLSYPDGIRYSEGMSISDDAMQSGFDQTVSNDGGLVGTDEPFRMFAKQISTQILQHPDVQVWNLSKHGVYINGTRIDGWWENGILAGSDVAEWLHRVRTEKRFGWRSKFFLLRQITDSTDIIMDRKAELAAEDLLEDICNAVLAEYIFEDICLSPGNDLKILVISDISGIEDADLNGIRLVICTQESFSGEPVYMEGAHERIYSSVSDNAETIRFGNKEYPYYQVPADPDTVSPDISYYREIMMFLSGQNGIQLFSTDRYSLFMAVCRKLLLTTTD